MNIEIYGAHWCKNTRKLCDKLKEENIEFVLREIDDKESGKEYTKKVLDLNQGKRITPTCIINDAIYSNPNEKEIGLIIEDLTQNEKGGLTKCSNGKTLENGDTVLLTRDLNVKGSSLNLKQGTALEKIKLTNDPAYIDCKVGKSTIAIKTAFIKKKG